jgi:hypothetical protein
MTNGQPPAKAWDLALEGIAKLAAQNDAIQATISEMQAQITYIRQSSAPISMMRAQNDDIAAISKDLLALGVRVAAVEEGATAAILDRLATDAEERAAADAADADDRRDRRTATDRMHAYLFWGFLGVVAALIGLAAIILWLGLRR